VFDAEFGQIRVSNARISNDTVDAYCSGMRKMGMHTLRAPTTNLARAMLQEEQHTEVEWVTMGVIVQTSGPLKSAKKVEYMVWRLNDLSNPQGDTLKLLLFADCVKSYEKLKTGTVVLLVNPQWAGADGDQEKEIPTLKVSRMAQVVEVGHCPDFGHCKANKSDGTCCSNVVNLSRSEHCAYHIQSVARRIAARRGVFNMAQNQPPKSWHLKSPAAKVEMHRARKSMPATLGREAKGSKRALDFVSAEAKGNSSSPMSAIHGNRTAISRVLLKRAPSTSPCVNDEHTPSKRRRSMREFIAEHMKPKV